MGIQSALVLMLYLLVGGCSSYAQQAKKHWFTIDELRPLATLIATQQFHQTELENLHAVLSKGTWRTKEGVLLSYSTLLEPDPIHCQILDSGYAFDRSIVVFRCTDNIGMLPGPVYIVAMGSDGGFYLLDGFDTVDFDRMIRYGTGVPHNRQKAEALARLFLRTSGYYGSRYATVVDTDNIDSLRTYYPEINPVEVSCDDKKCRATLFTVDIVTGNVARHTVDIESDGNVIYSYDVKKEEKSN